MKLKERIESFVLLGQILKNIGEGNQWTGYENGITETEYNNLDHLVMNVYKYNGWFSEEMVRKSMYSIGESLTNQNLTEWIKHYGEDSFDGGKSKKVAVIMAGNIPLVGFHDFLVVLLSGHKFLGKCSSKDEKLLKIVAGILKTLNPGFENKIQFVDGKINEMDAVIATGSNNSFRYFEYYFSRYPSVLRRNRNSVAILDGSESDEELAGLGNDMLDYYGLGCRNVSKLFLPKNYDLDKIFKNVFFKRTVLDNKKYVNNYDYQKALYLMNNSQLIENGFLLLKEDSALASPVSTIFYEFYEDYHHLEGKLESSKDQIQCVVSKKHVSFGCAQKPKLWDYADNLDTLKFLLNLNNR